MKHKLSISLIALALAISQPASAHDAMVSQSPGQGETVTAGPFDIRLEFSDTPMAVGEGSGNEISIKGPSGEVEYSGCLPIEGNFGVLRVDLDQAGTYSVGWRVVSSDGHPISGEFTFELENSSGYVADPEFTFPNCGDGLVTPNQQSADLYWLLWLSLGVVAAGIFFFLRPKKKI
jgi:hypothetical protein